MVDGPTDAQGKPLDPFSSSLPTGFRFEGLVETNRKPSERITQTGRQRPVDIELPFTIGDYTLTEQLGTGAMGSVYRARQESLDRDVALKMLAPHLVDDADLVRRFHYEARAAGKILHDNVVQAYGTGVGEGWHYIAMEFVDGPSVSSLMEAGGPLDERLALRIVRDVAGGIQAIADAGMVHRDVKPQNILMAPGKLAKLSDLGLVKHLGNDLSGARTQTGIVMGTPHYMAPEQAMGQSIDIRADIYALGVSLYRMLTGQFPFDGDNAFVILQRHCMEDVPDARLLRPSVTEGAVQLIARMTVRNPAGRYATSEQIIAEVSHLLGEGGPIATPAPGSLAPVHPTPAPHSPVHPTPAPHSPVSPVMQGHSPVHPPLQSPVLLEAGPRVIEPASDKKAGPRRAAAARPPAKRAPGGVPARRVPSSRDTMAANRRTPSSDTVRAAGRAKRRPPAPVRRTTKRASDRRPGRGAPLMILFLCALAFGGIVLAVVGPKPAPIDRPQEIRQAAKQAIDRGQVVEACQALRKLPPGIPDYQELRRPLVHLIETSRWRVGVPAAVGQLCREGRLDEAERAVATLRWVASSDVAAGILQAAEDEADRAARERSLDEDRRVLPLLELAVDRCRVLAGRPGWKPADVGDEKRWPQPMEPAHKLALFYVGKGASDAFENLKVLRTQLEQNPETTPTQKARFDEAASAVQLLRGRKTGEPGEQPAEGAGEGEVDLGGSGKRVPWPGRKKRPEDGKASDPASEGGGEKPKESSGEDGSSKQSAGDDGKPKQSAGDEGGAKPSPPTGGPPGGIAPAGEPGPAKGEDPEPEPEEKPAPTEPTPPSEPEPAPPPGDG